MSERRGREKTSVRGARSARERAGDARRAPSSAARGEARAGERTGDESGDAHDLLVEPAPRGFGGHAPLPAHGGGARARHLRAAGGDERGIVVDAKRLHLRRQRHGDRRELCRVPRARPGARRRSCAEGARSSRARRGVRPRARGRPTRAFGGGHKHFIPARRSRTSRQTRAASAFPPNPEAQDRGAPIRMAPSLEIIRVTWFRARPLSSSRSWERKKRPGMRYKIANTRARFYLFPRAARA